MATDYRQILPTGKKNALSTPELQHRMGFRNVRALRKDIAQSRIDGQIICCSADGGYYLPANREEIREFVAIIESRAISTLAVLKSARAALKEAEGQLHVFDIDRCGGRQPNE